MRWRLAWDKAGGAKSELGVEVVGFVSMNLFSSSSAVCRGAELQT